jgi:hypothetical protein
MVKKKRDTHIIEESFHKMKRSKYRKCVNIDFELSLGTVQTPSGAYTPIPRFTPNLPSNGPINTMTSGTLNKFTFIGQQWRSHPTLGVDWDVYLLSEDNQQWFIGFNFNFNFISQPIQSGYNEMFLKNSILSFLVVQVIGDTINIQLWK